MKRVLTRTGQVLALLVMVAAAVGLWRQNDIRRLLAVINLFREDRIVQNFSHMDTMFPVREMERGALPVAPLPQGEAFALPPRAQAWIEDRRLTSLLVLHRGQVVYEDYFQGTGPEDRRVSWSMAKSWLSALYGVLLAEGAVPPLDDLVTDHVTTLQDSAYHGATIRNLMQMSSGIKFNEDYLDFWSDINKMGRILAIGGSLDEFAAARDQQLREPGSAMEYNSIDTHVIGMVIREATGRTIPDLMAEKIIGPLGLEASPYYLTDTRGAAFVLGGLNMRTRDYARFGQMVAQDGEWQGRQVVPADWLALTTVASAKTAPGERQYGYQWWLPADARPGEVLMQGVYGQNTFIDREAQVVIVRTSGDRGFREDGTNEETVEICREIVAALAGR